jgi:lysyl-tRNA synthetase class 2
MPQRPAPAETPWWDADRHADRRGILRARGRILRAIRGHLEAEGFDEVEPCALQISPGNEAHLHAFVTEAIGHDGQGVRMYLHTSPEFAMKKLLAAGERRIHAFARVWRNRERGALHSPEFTMLEWYRAGEGYAAVMADAVAFLRLAAEAAGAGLMRHHEATCDPFAAPERLGLPEAFARHAGIDLLATMAPDGAPDRAAMAAALRGAGIRHAADDTWSDMFARVLVQCIEPRLGMGRATILDRYPVAEAALARRSAEDPRLAERFEIYVCGVEVANGFGELTDAAEQGRRLAAEMDEKARIYGQRYPVDPGFLAAVGRMPEAAGCAMGFDRLVMLATGAPRIDDVMWVPVETP